MMKSILSRRRVYLFDTIDPWIGCVKYDCKYCGIRGLKPDKCDLAVCVEYDEQPQDIEHVLTSTLVSRKVREAIVAGGLSGIEFYDALEFRPASNSSHLVEFTRQCSEEYKVKWVYGSGGSIARTCGVKVARACDHCGWVAWTLPPDGIIIDENEWDGSDFFQIIELPGPTFMSERAVTVLSQAGLSNFNYVAAEDHIPGRFS